MNRESVRKIMRSEFRPYKGTKVHKIYDHDLERRRDFCEWALQKLTGDRDFFRKVCFTDESTFTNNGPVNKQNVREWTPNNNHWVIEQDSQRRWKVNVWAGIVGDRIIGPVFFNENLNGRLYTSFLRRIVPRLLAGNFIIILSKKAVLKRYLGGTWAVLEPYMGGT